MTATAQKPKKQQERLSVTFADTPNAREAKHRWDCYPELLAALKRLVNCGTSEHEYDGAMMQARAVIAKAEGR